MRTVSTAQQAVLEDPNRYSFLRVEVADSGGTFRDLSNLSTQDWQKNARISWDVNQRVREASVELFLADEGGESLAPLSTTSTFTGYVDIGRDWRIYGAVSTATATPSSSSFDLLLDGEIDEYDHPNNGQGLSLVGRDAMSLLADRWVEEETVYGTEAGRAIESVMQDIIDDWADGTFTLYTPSSPGFLITPYNQQQQSVLEALQVLADLIGWVVEYRWDNGTSAFRVTFYEPDRSASVADWTFGDDEYFSVNQLRISRHDIRNVVSVKYTSTGGSRNEHIASSTTSIDSYGRRWMQIEESDDSPIDSDAEAQTMADAAISDLANPVADQEIEAPLFWPAQLGDYYTFSANGVHYTADQSFGVTGITHQWSQGTGRTFVRTRGKPSGHTKGWIRRQRKERPPTEVIKSVELLNFREISRNSTSVTYGWELGSDLYGAYIHDFTETQPYSTDKWPTDDRVPDKIDTVRDTSYQVDIPEQGDVRYFQVEGRKQNGSLGDMERALIFPLNVAGDFIAFAELTVTQSDGSVEVTGWTTDRAQSVAYAYNVGTAPSAPTEAQAEAQGTGATGGGLVTGFTSDFTISLGAGTLAYGETIKLLLIAYINADGTGPDGTATDHGLPVGVQGERLKLTDSDAIADGVVIARAMRENLQGFGFSGTWDGTAQATVTWSSGTLSLADGNSYSIVSGSLTSMSAGVLYYFYFDSTVSTTVIQTTTSLTTATTEPAILLAWGRRATTSSQNAWVVPRVGMARINSELMHLNSITETIIADDSITTPKVVALNITGAKIAGRTIEAGKVVANTLTGNEITGTTLGAIYADIGTVTAGTLQNSGGTFVINLDATGSGALIDHSNMQVRADGTATFETEIIVGYENHPLGAFTTIDHGAVTAVDVTTNNFDHGDSGSNTLGFYGATPGTQSTVSGSRGGNAALASLLTALDTLGLIVDNSTT